LRDNIAKDTCDKRLLFKLYEGHLKLNNKKLNLKMGQDLNRQFTKDNIQLPRKLMKTCSTSHIITSVKHQTLEGVWSDRRNCQSLVGGGQNGKATLEDSLEVPYKTKCPH
jgi:hypothetical protein